MLLALIVLFPLAGWLVCGLAGRLSGRGAGILASAAVGLSFVAAVAAVRQPATADGWTVPLFPWIAAGAFSVTAGLTMDRLAAVMTLVVSGVSFLIHVYSIGYMAGDPGCRRYFAYLNLFVASMLLLVLGSNLLVLFVGWELVGLCSYLLIGFWFDRVRAAVAARKAFLVNRIGDAAFLVGVLLLAVHAPTLEFAGLPATVAALDPPTVTLIALLLFAGATGKSAQLPLYVWLPDAMEGPTPVSALIHAATMVTAGVYLIARLHPLFLAADLALAVVAAAGAATAFFAATVALAEPDLKRVLAYSTISQLGYMFLAMGVVAMPAGLFHLTSHAFFKALLFLAAGAVMHAMHDVIDLRRLGGLAVPMRWTALGFLVGAAALAGVPPSAGFFSKDLILEHAFLHAAHGGTILLWLAGVATAFVTALYITRAAILTFAPPAAHREHPHEPPPVMGWPMAVLAALSLLGGALGARALGAPLLHWLEAFFPPPPASVAPPGPAVAAIPVAASGLGILAGWLIYRGRRDPALGPVGALLRQQWYVQAFYDRALVGPGRVLAGMLAGAVDLGIIDGAVNGLAAAVRRAGAGLRRVQTGYVRHYAAILLVGTVAVLGYWLLR